MTDERHTVELLKKYIINNKASGFLEKKFCIAAATLDRQGKLIAIGLNSSVKTHPLMQHYCTKIHNQYKIFLHAEISALVRSQREVHTLIVMRLNKAGQIALAKPCPLCQMAIRDAGIKKTYYTNNANEIVLLA